MENSLVETGYRKWIITITVILAALLEVIDSTVVNVSMTQIMGNLGATLEEVAWVITTYAVANVIIVPMTGWLSAKFGRKNYFAASIVLFTVASFFCGHATNIWGLVIFRFIQGIGGGALLSTSQSILVETFPKKELGMATALFGLGILIGPSIGPTLGGYITDNYSWPWIFYINIPIGIMALIMTMAFIRGTADKQQPKGIDWTGIILLVTGVGALQTVLEMGEKEDWFDAPYIVVLTVVSVLAIVGFIWHELTTENPIVNLRVLKNKSLSIGMVFTFILGFGLFASVFVFPILCQNLLGFTAAQTGLLMLPGSLVTGMMMPFIGTMLKKGFPPQIMASIGFALFFVATWMLSNSTLASGPDDFFWPLIVRGIGLSFLFVPLTTMALSSLEGKEVPQGTGLNNMMRQLGGSFGVALMTTFISQRVMLHRVNLIGNLNPFNPAFQERVGMYTKAFISKGFSFMQAEQMANKAIDGTLMKQSMLMAYMDAFFVVGLFFIACIPIVLIFQRQRIKGPVVLDAH